MNKDNVILFIDNVGRNIIGEVISETLETITVLNPIVIDFQPKPQASQIEIKTQFLLFRDVVDNDPCLVYNKSTITQLVNSRLIDKIIISYEKLCNDIKKPIQTPVSNQSEKGVNFQAVKLFDEEV